jgi:hypothetical protein
MSKKNQTTIFTLQWSIHFLNTVLSLIFSIENYESIALDRQNTHPLENFLVTCEWTWEHILREFNPTLSFFIRLIEVLIQSSQQVRPVFSLPGPIANQTISSRIFAFSLDPAHADLIYLPSKKCKARALLTAAKQSEELRGVAEIVGCEVDELVEMMRQNPTELGLTGAYPLIMQRREK